MSIGCILLCLNMPFRRKTMSHRPRRRTHRRARRHGKSTRALAKMALRLNKPEKKFQLYRDVTSVDIDWAGFVVDLFGAVGVPQGIGVTNRVGNRAWLKGTTAYVELALDTNQLANTIRVIFGYTVDSALPAVTDILSDIGDIGAPLSHYSVSNIGNFQILYDRRITLDQAAKPLIVIKKQLSWNLKLNFAGGAVVVPDNFRPFMLMISDQDNASAQKPQAVWDLRSRFTDA